MITDRYDLEKKKQVQEEIVREIKHLAKTTTSSRFDIIKINYKIEKIKTRKENSYA